MNYETLNAETTHTQSLSEKNTSCVKVKEMYLFLSLYINDIHWLSICTLLHDRTALIKLVCFHKGTVQPCDEHM